MNPCDVWVCDDGNTTPTFTRRLPDKGVYVCYGRASTTALLVCTIHESHVSSRIDIEPFGVHHSAKSQISEKRDT